MEDVALAAFSVFFTQSPSFLAHQTAMTETHGNSNAQTLFGMRHIPTDNHIRGLLDAVPPQQVIPMFERIFTALHERGHLQALRTFDGQLLIRPGWYPVSPIEQYPLQALYCHQTQQQTN